MNPPTESNTAVSSPARRQWLARLAAPLVASTLSACQRQAAGPMLWPSGSAQAPTLEYTLLDGRRAQSTSWATQVVLVNFWATTCGICVREMPALVDTHLKFAPLGLRTLAVAVRHDPPARVADFAQTRKLPFDVVIDNMGAVARAFGDVRATPTTFLVDRQGRLALSLQGALDFRALHAHIQRALQS